MNKIPQPIAIIERNKGQWYLQWADGVISEDFYNKTRANDILKNYDYYRNNMLKRNQKGISQALEGRG